MTDHGWELFCTSEPFCFSTSAQRLLTAFGLICTYATAPLVSHAPVANAGATGAACR